ncbi:MAG: hypothetical protein WA913_04120 [Pricia sp.]
MSLLSFIVLLACLQQTSFVQIDSVSNGYETIAREPSLIIADSVTYSDAKLDIAGLRTRLSKDLQEERIGIDSVKQVFADRLVNQIIPYWYGTEWSFGGHTSIPKVGKIACGYFVSTTLKDMGLRLNRYKLAQKSPMDEALAIGCGARVVTVSDKNPDRAFEQIQDRVGEGIYFIGFDTGHVGFVIRKEKRLLLIHSNYLTPISVCVEPLNTAQVFKTFTKFHLVPISHNDLFIKKWLNRGVLPN